YRCLESSDAASFDDNSHTSTSPQEPHEKNGKDEEPIGSLDRKVTFKKFNDEREGYYYLTPSNFLYGKTCWKRHLPSRKKSTLQPTKFVTNITTSEQTSDCRKYTAFISSRASLPK
ncbi:hypothetical protein ACTXT7_017533, partial [Hymenolepis weldensis]